MIDKENKIYEPDELLNRLNQELRTTLKQDYDEVSTIRDGMDIACCTYDTEKKSLQFAGANKKLFLIRNNHLHEFKGNNKALGLPPSYGGLLKYDRIDVKILPGDKIYLLSDGYQDQFGGERNKKFKTKNLKQLLLKISNYPMSDQQEIIKENFENWKGNNFQVDDILVMGIAF